MVFRSAATNAEPKPNRIGSTDSVSFCVRSSPTRNETLRAWGGARHFTFSYEFETLAEGALFELYIDNNQLATHDVLARLRVRPTLAWLA